MSTSKSEYVTREFGTPNKRSLLPLACKDAASPFSIVADVRSGWSARPSQANSYPLSSIERHSLKRLQARFKDGKIDKKVWIFECEDGYFSICYFGISMWFCITCNNKINTNLLAKICFNKDTLFFSLFI